MSSACNTRTRALRFLLEGAKRGEPVLYITLSETADELKSVAASHGWDLTGVTVRELLPQEDTLNTDEQYTMFHPSEVELATTTKLLLQDVDTLKPTTSRIVNMPTLHSKCRSRAPQRFDGSASLACPTGCPD